MGSDRARITYDAARQYRRVIAQQGRVVVEADLNEANEILAEEARLHVLDLVGPFGVPHAGGRERSSGYEIRPDDGTFKIGKGPLYVGGWRVEQEKDDLALEAQTEGLEGSWLDAEVPAWQAESGDALALLYLREQEVGAIEDPDLVDVALGGPDTGQRLRLIRRVMLAAVNEPGRAFEEIVERLRDRGHVFDGREMRLRRRGRLCVNSTSDESTGRSSARQSYLGAENQLMRVQIARPPPDARPGEHFLLWGYDNASSLYRVDIDDKDPQTLKLRTVPVDAHHHPRKHQFVEVLLETANLGGKSHIAAPSGYPYSLLEGYNPDDKTIKIHEPLAPALLNGKGALFVRIWVREQRFHLDTPLELADENAQLIGVSVSLSRDQAEPPCELPFVPGDFWCFALRPAAPTKIDPARYAVPQPPEGPREWLCPLAIWESARGEILDMRPQFDARLHPRHEITVSPRDLGDHRTLQSVIDEACLRRSSGRPIVRLSPGVYELLAPLHLGPEHSHLTLEGTEDGAVIRASSRAKTHAFHNGMLVVNGTRHLGLKRLQFALHWSEALPAWFDGEELQRHKLHHELRVAVGVRALHCEDLAIERCVFEYETPSAKHPLFGAAVFAGAACHGFALHHCRVAMPRDRSAHRRREEERLIYGFFMGPARALEDPSMVLSPTLTGATFRNNQFAGLTAAVLIRADLGPMRVDQNEVAESEGGFWVFSLGTLSLAGWLFGRNGGKNELDLFADRIFLQDERLRRSASIAYFFRIEGKPEHVVMAAALEDELKATRHDIVAPILSWLHARLHRGGEKEHARPSRKFTFGAAHNRVELIDGPGAALLVSHTEPDCASSLVLNANDFETGSEHVPSVTVFLAGRATVTGNVVVNRALGEGHSLAVIPLRNGGKGDDLVAVTGNVLEGKVKLPGRRKGLLDWVTYNEVRG